MTNRRSTRYEVTVIRADGSTEVIQANSRRVDAIDRAKFVAADRAGWSRVISAYVRDTMPEMVEGRFVLIPAQFNRTDCK